MLRGGGTAAVVRVASGADDGGGAGEVARDPGTGVDVAVGCEEPCFFFDFFRADSVPLTSDRFGEPGRLSVDAAFFNGSTCLLRPDGVLVPFVEAPEGCLLLSFSLLVALSDFSSPFFRSSSFRFSSSESSESLYHPLLA